MKSQVFHLSSTLQTMVFILLVLLGQPPRGLMLPHHPMLYLMGNPEWKSTMLQLETSLDGPGGEQGSNLQPWVLIKSQGPDRLLNEVLGLRREDILKNQKREELGWRPMGTFSENDIASLPYSHGGGVEVEGGEKRNEALTSIAGGLQAFNRQKGGFGFRFG